MAGNNCQQLLQKGSNLVLLLLGLLSIVYWVITLKDFYHSNSHKTVSNSDISSDYHDVNKLFHEVPVFNVVLAVLGFFMVLTATIGICCAQQSCCRCFYLFLAWVIMLAQIALVIVLFIKNVKVYFPKDASGHLGSFEEFIKENLMPMQIIILVFEAICIFTSCCCGCCCGDTYRSDSQRTNNFDEDFGEALLPSIYQNNHANQCNPNNKRYNGYTRYYKGTATRADLNNHSNQMNPNNWRYQ